MSRNLDPEKLTGKPEGGSIPSNGEDLQQVDRLLRFLRTRKFYGKVTLSFEKGKVVHVRKEDSLSLRENDIDRLTSDL